MASASRLYLFMSQRHYKTLGTIATVTLVLCLWASALLMPTPIQHEPLRVAVGMWPGAEPWILAREAGEINPSRVNLVEMNWTSAAMRAVGNGVVDAAVLSLDEVIRQIHQGYPLKIVMVTDISRGADLLMANPTLTSIQDLKGRRIGYEPRTSGAWLLSKALKNATLKLADVQQVPLNPGEVEEIYEELNLDGVVLSEPWRQRLNGLNLKNLYDSSSPNSFIVRVLAVHSDAITDHREALISILRAHFKWMPKLQHEEVISGSILRREGISNEVFQNILSHLEMVNLERNQALLSQREPWLGKLFQDLQIDLVEDTTSGAPLNPSDVFDAELLEELP